MKIETDLDEKTVGAIEAHYNHVREKYPYFCDMITCLSDVGADYDVIPAHAVEECYDVIAVLLRTIDVLEGRQKLGRPKKGDER